MDVDFYLLKYVTTDTLNSNFLLPCPCIWHYLKWIHLYFGFIYSITSYLLKKSFQVFNYIKAFWFCPHLRLFTLEHFYLKNCKSFHKYASLYFKNGYFRKINTGQLFRRNKMIFICTCICFPPHSLGVNLTS